MESGNNALVQTSCDVKDLATAYEYFSEVVGDRPRSRSELVRMIVETFSAVLVSNQVVKKWDSVADADRLMKLAFGPAGMNPGGRRGSTLLMQKQVEDGVPIQFIKSVRSKKKVSEEEKEAQAERDAKDPYIQRQVLDQLMELEKEVEKRDKEELEEQKKGMMLREKPKELIEEKGHE